MEGHSRPRRRDTDRGRHFRGDSRRVHTQEPRGGHEGHDQRQLRLRAQGFVPAAADGNAVVHFARGDAGVQDEILEHRRGGAGADGSARGCGVHVLLREDPDAQLAAPDSDVRGVALLRNPVGDHSRDLQGGVEHERDALHADDELRGDAAHSGLRLNLGAERLGRYGSHQPGHLQGLAA